MFLEMNYQELSNTQLNVEKYLLNTRANKAIAEINKWERDNNAIYDISPMQEELMDVTVQLKELERVIDDRAKKERDEDIVIFALSFIVVTTMLFVFFLMLLEIMA